MGCKRLFTAGWRQLHPERGHRPRVARGVLSPRRWSRACGAASSPSLTGALVPATPRRNTSAPAAAPAGSGAEAPGC